MWCLLPPRGFWGHSLRGLPGNRCCLSTRPGGLGSGLDFYLHSGSSEFCLHLPGVRSCALGTGSTGTVRGALSESSPPQINTRVIGSDRQGRRATGSRSALSFPPRRRGTRPCRIPPAGGTSQPLLLPVCPRQVCAREDEDRGGHACGGAHGHRAGRRPGPEALAV